MVWRGRPRPRTVVSFMAHQPEYGILRRETVLDGRGCPPFAAFKGVHLSGRIRSLGFRVSFF